MLRRLLRKSAKPFGLLPLAVVVGPKEGSSSSWTNNAPNRLRTTSFQQTSTYRCYSIVQHKPDDLDIIFDFNYATSQLHAQHHHHFVFNGEQSGQILQLIDLAMAILSNGNTQEKVNLTQKASFLNHETANCDQISSQDFSEAIRERKQLYLTQFAHETYMPERPELPKLLDDMKQIPMNYKQAGVSLPVFLLHNMAHIELNAIDLCWHTCLMCLLHRIEPRDDHHSREDESSESKSIGTSNGGELPLEDFINDFIKIAKDESRHFVELSDRLKELGSFYGKVDSHRAIWNLARDTQLSLMERLVIGNCVLEGRGLDSGERLISKMIGCGDVKSSKLVQTICDEEEDHVRIGVKWFDLLSQHMFPSESIPIGDLATFQKQIFQQIVLKHYGPLPGPFNHVSRQSANMKQEWYEEISREKLIPKKHK